VHGLVSCGDAIADRIHRETEVGAVPGGLLDDEVGSHTGQEYSGDSRGTPASRAVP
jgi:hypothetical protein